jgi:hypothetical protein
MPNAKCRPVLSEAEGMELIVAEFYASFVSAEPNGFGFD